MKVLLIEDEEKVVEGIRPILEKEGFLVDAALDGSSGLDAMLSDVYDLVLLDILLPDMNGLDVLRQARSEEVETPVILLTGKSRTEDKIIGLNAGADDYLTKPFDAGELLARINARIRHHNSGRERELNVGDLRLEQATYKLYGPEKSVKMTKKEYQLLEYLMLNERKILSRDLLISRVWGMDSEADDNNLEVYISFVRKKIKFVESSTVLLTVKGVGYSVEAGKC